MCYYPDSGLLGTDITEFGTYKPTNKRNVISPYPRLE